MQNTKRGREQSPVSFMFFFFQRCSNHFYPASRTVLFFKSRIKTKTLRHYPKLMSFKIQYRNSIMECYYKCCLLYISFLLQLKSA